MLSKNANERVEFVRGIAVGRFIKLQDYFDNDIGWPVLWDSLALDIKLAPSHGENMVSVTVTLLNFKGFALIIPEQGESWISQDIYRLIKELKQYIELVFLKDEFLFWEF